MASPQRSVPASSLAPAQPAAVRPVPLPVPLRPVPVRQASVRQASVRSTVAAGRGPRSVAPATVRRDPVRPGARPARLDGVAGVRPVRGGCSPEGPARSAGGARPVRYEDAGHSPLRLTRRGRRVVAGLSIAIGLTIAAVTVSVELADRDGGLELAGSSTVVVQSGDTLWSLAQEVAPEEDPRGVVDAIVDLNGLAGVDLVPGQVLQLP
jgi:nucleoid-associated protein YgaU